MPDNEHFSPYTFLTMITTSFAHGDSWGKSDQWGYEPEHDDLMDADDYDDRAAARDGWAAACWDGRM
jgi:hypothetical protein